MGYTTFSIADWDADGLPDIVFNSIWALSSGFEMSARGRASAPDKPQAILFEASEHARATGGGVAFCGKPAWTWWEPLPGNW
jgi:hypothetical protein